MARGGGVSNLIEALNPFASVTKKSGQAKIGSVQTNLVLTKLFAEISQIGQTKFFESSLFSTLGI